jgi:uroporphyrinogen-III synthase
MKEDAPLAGKHIVNTRAVHQADEFNALIRERGAVPLDYPCISIVPPRDTRALDDGLQRLSAGEYDWLVFTSANTVLSLSQRLEALGLSLPEDQPFKVAAVGPATADAARDLLGLRVDAIPDEHVAEALAKAIRDGGGRRVLLPESAIARATLKDSLRSARFEVHAVDAYRTVRGSGGVDLPAYLRRGEVHVVAFTSSSTVEQFLTRLQLDGLDRHALDGVCVACIGPKTAATARQHGLTVSVVPDVYTLPGLLDAVAQYFKTTEHS